MPIKINLLAEAQEAEESQRRHPVRLAVWVASFIVCLVLVWMLKLGLEIHFAKVDYSSVEKRWAELDTQNAATASRRIKFAEIDRKLAALNRLTTGRFLWGPLLSSLERTTVDHIQVTHLSSDQTDTAEDPVVVGSGAHKVVIPGAVVESISLSIQATDTSVDHQACNKYEERLNTSDYFVKTLQRRDGFVVGEVSRFRSFLPSDPSREYMTFVLAARFPEVRHSE